MNRISKAITVALMGNNAASSGNSPNSVHVIYGGKKDNASIIDRLNDECDDPCIIVTTYKFSSVGLDVRNMDTILLADSVKS